MSNVKCGFHSVERVSISCSLDTAVYLLTKVYSRGLLYSITSVSVNKEHFARVKRLHMIYTLSLDLLNMHAVANIYIGRAWGAGHVYLNLIFRQNFP